MPSSLPYAGPQPTLSASAAVQPIHQDEAENEEDDRFGSPPGLWLPTMVVKKHRREAVIIWVFLLTGFLFYVGYIIWETMDSRKYPASSIELKQEHHKFPDIMFCTEFSAGCLSISNNCFELASANIFSFNGFLDDEDTFIEDNADAGEAIVDEHPNCFVVPLSRLTVDEEGIKNGDVTSFDVSFFLMWDEKPAAYDFETYQINTQFLDTFFIDVESDPETLRDLSVDVRLPYARVYLAPETEVTTVVNHMVLSLTEFAGINGNGQQEESQQTFSQATTTGVQNWWWNEIDAEIELALLMVDVSIPKFVYTSIEEVDPVDVWSIIGAIGGIWQFVVTGFGLFFVYSVKQSPDRKIRNFRKSVVKPGVVIQKRLSSLSSRTSNQDVEIDATDEDLPSEWVKKQKPNGSIYYFHVLDGIRQTTPPHGLEGASRTVPHPQPPTLPRKSAASRFFQPYGGGGGGGGEQKSDKQSGGEDGDDSALPPGWMKRRNDSGRMYYLNTMNKTTQWERPTQRAYSDGGSHGRPRVVDAPMAHQRRGSRGSGISSVHPRHSSSSSDAPNRAHSASLAAPVGVTAAATAPSVADRRAAFVGTPSAPSYHTAVHLSNSSSAAAAGAAEAAEIDAGAPLPRNWLRRTGPGNRTYYVNTVTMESKWEYPQS
ncbi:unnamed protein product [Scytosiphon promiscuus]